VSYKVSGWIANALLGYAARKPNPTFEKCVETQKELLLSLVGKASPTRFGVDHDFADIKDVTQFQALVPMRDYSDFWETYWSKTFPILDDVTWPGRIPYFAKTSGTTTGKSKFLPCSLDRVSADNRAGLQVIIEHLRSRPKSKALLGRYFMFAGSPNLENLGDGIYAGELSGISANERPFWAGASRYYPPNVLAQITDWNEKVRLLSKDCLDKNIRAISGLPSWLKLLLVRVFDNDPERRQQLREYFPDLEMIVHGGMSFDPYRNFFDQINEHQHVDFREIYAASEGFFGVSDQTPEEGMRLISDSGVFYEFVRLDEFYSPNPRRYWLQNIQNGVDYTLVVSTCAGLWSYVVGDVIKFTNKDKLRFKFSGRLSQTLSTFGEKVLNDEIEQAVSTAASSLGYNIDDFCVYSAFVDDKKSIGRYQFFIETDTTDNQAIKLLAEAIDDHLKKTNSGYDTRRKNNLGIVEPVVNLMRKGTFEFWMSAKGKAGGQHKVPRVINRQQSAELQSLAQARQTSASGI